MATVTKRFSFATTSEGYVATTGGAGTTLAWDGTTGNPAGSLKNSLSGRSLSTNNYWQWTGTWESLGVPPNSLVTGIKLNLAYYRCPTFTTGGSGNTVGPFTLHDSTGTQLLSLWAGATFTATSASWTTVASQVSQSVPTSQQASTSSIKLRLNTALRTGNSTSSVVTVNIDEVEFIITYVNYFKSNSSLSRGNSLVATGSTSAPSYKGGLTLSHNELFSAKALFVPPKYTGSSSLVKQGSLVDRGKMTPVYSGNSFLSKVIIVSQSGHIPPPPVFSAGTDLSKGIYVQSFGTYHIPIFTGRT